MSWAQVVDGVVCAVVILGLGFFAMVYVHGWPGSGDD